MATPPVLLVTLTTCGHCAEAKAYFQKRGIVPTVIEFDKVSVDLKRRIAADMRAQPRRRLPVRDDRRKAVNGYDPAAYERLLSMN